MVTLASSSSLTSKSMCEQLTLGNLIDIARFGVIKVCDEFPGFSRFKEHQPYGAPSPKQISVARSHAQHPTDTYPDASEVSIKKAIATFLPRFREKELFNRALCWCTDTADAALLMCEHPKWKTSFSPLATAGKLPCRSCSV
jgi:sarcosine oxidase/L-pipecolate oxidase